jgi:cytidylate kinase
MNDPVTIHRNIDAPKKLIIAIDGPAGAGKSTVAQKVAQHLSYLYIDTGAMYRGITWKALREGIDWSDATAIADLAAQTTIALLAPTDPTDKQRVWVDRQDVTVEIRLPEVSQHVSQVAAIPAVRQILTAQQQALGGHGGVVMDGRDIGTAVFPQADLKIYLTASTRERTRRRFVELSAQGLAVDFEALEMAITKRDEADAARDVAPLQVASDAIIIDSDNHGIDSVVAMVLHQVESIQCSEAAAS